MRPQGHLAQQGQQGVGYTASPQQILQASANADLFGSLSALSRPAAASSSSSSPPPNKSTGGGAGDFWNEKRIEVDESVGAKKGSSAAFTIDNDPSNKTWKWQW
jgi:hypothetical protein